MVLECGLGRRLELDIRIVPLGQSSSLGMPFAFSRGLQMSMVKVVFVIVGEGE